ncbi:MAG: NAD(P)/FAD-dependent oxidoreductase [Phycisphaerae bacterium]
MSEARASESRHRVLIIGGGFGGLYLAKSLRRAPVDVTLIDRRNFHLFQPLLYQVATGGLSPANIAAPLRCILKSQRNAHVVLGDVTAIDTNARIVGLADGGEFPFDTLVVAAGVGNNYFGNDQWEPHAPGLKSLEEATEIRRRILLAFERAEREDDHGRARQWLTFCVIGGGPTGVELAGTLAEIARHTLRREFRRINPADATVTLIEAGERILPSYDPISSERAADSLRRLGVVLRMNTRVTDVQPGVVRLRSGEVNESLAAHTVLWSAGVQGSPLGRMLAEQTGCELDRMGRVMVGGDCTIVGYPHIYVIGDLAHFRGPGGKPLPGVAPVAMQQGRYVAQQIMSRLRSVSLDPFVYDDKGSMATIGRNAAVAEIRGWKFSGYIAWLAWLFIHIVFLIEFQNRLLVLVQWAWNYFTWARSARLITEPPRPRE